ncbi:13071_t:CDS:1 [Funneliformis geosporum]|uniref:13071_t:CDS:1 n=1 Tax=Funneliformis geosporum TaxID=1117311 RepID=A0A9W4WQF5_9GLOM|nr:13071_t:CDS:1 [Funneliformis geosporum]
MVKNLQGLQKLYMYRSFTSDLIVKSLIPQIPKLRKLDLGISKPKITDVAAEVIAQHCPNLVHLSLSFSLVTCEGLRIIGQGCKKLSFLDLSGCCHIGHGLYDVLKYFTQLKTLYLKSLLQISGKSFSSIIKSNIEHVSFFSSKILEEETYDVPSKEDKSYSKVKKLILDYCEVSNSNLKQIAHWSKNLEHLDISLVYDADDEILQFLCDNLENLKFVLARGCYRISQVKQGELNKHQRINFSF